MRPVTSWQENQNYVQNAIGLNSTFAMTPVPRLLCNPPPSTVFQKKEHSCSSLLLTPIKLELGMRVRGSDPRTQSDVRTWSETHHQKLFILHFPKVEQRHWGVDKTLQLLSSPSSAGSRSLGDNPVWIPSFWAEDKAQPVSPQRVGRVGWLHLPLSQKLHLSYVRVTKWPKFKKFVLSAM